MFVFDNVFFSFQPWHLERDTLGLFLWGDVGTRLAVGDKGASPVGGRQTGRPGDNNDGGMRRDTRWLSVYLLQRTSYILVDCAKLSWMAY